MDHHGIVDLRSPAKINLFLSVTGRRSDGYHTLETLMCPVALFDRIRLRFDGKGIRVRCEHPGVPSDETNLVCQAVNALRSALRGSPAALPHGMAFRIDKSIPVGAGLGGGSSNAASVLLALNRYLGDPITPLELNRIGASIGADVPFFTVGASHCEGHRRTARIVSGAAANDGRHHLSRLWRIHRRCLWTTEFDIDKMPKKLKKSLFGENLFNLRAHLCNDLESVTMTDYPAIGTAKKALVSWGAGGALMSGTGSAVYGLFKDADTAHHASVRIAAIHPEWQVFKAALMVE